MLMPQILALLLRIGVQLLLILQTEAHGCRLLMHGLSRVSCPDVPALIPVFGRANRLLRALRIVLFWGNTTEHWGQIAWLPLSR